MPNINDTYASVLSGYSGSVNDRRSELLTGILAYATPLSLNDMEAAALASLGYTGALNDAWDKYIKALGGFGISVKADYLSSTFYGNPIPFLFASAQPGVWYDPSDLTTLFQDSAGTTPVTAPNQTVGKMLDKSGRGNHATQATSTQRPIYGINPITGTRNLLTYTEQFDNAAWTKTNTTVSADNVTAPNGTLTADAATTTAASSAITRSFAILADSATYTASIYIKYVSGSTTVRLRAALTGGTSVAKILRVNSQTGAFVASDTTYAITDVGGGWYRISMQITNNGTNTTFNYQLYCTDDATNTNATAIWGAQLELGSTATAYQKVVTQYEVTQTGIPSVSYIAFDGVDDGMVTGTITPATDKVQVFAGVRKLSDAAQKIVAEMSATIASNAGSFALTAPNSAAANYNFSSKGTTQTDNVVTTYTAPITNVISGLGDIAGASNLIRANGAQVGSTLTTQGTGNYLAYPLYIGRRGGTTLPYNGRLYSLIVRFGANLTTGQITSTEKWVNSKTGAF
jgi:hypothetical protein